MPLGQVVRLALIAAAGIVLSPNRPCAADPVKAVAGPKAKRVWYDSAYDTRIKIAGGELIVSQKTFRDFDGKPHSHVVVAGFAEGSRADAHKRTVTEIRLVTDAQAQQDIVRVLTSESFHGPIHFWKE